MTSNEDQILESLPPDLKERIGWGLYGGIVQFYITKVDGTLAQLGGKLTTDFDKLRKIVQRQDKEMVRLMRETNSKIQPNIKVGTILVRDSKAWDLS